MTAIVISLVGVLGWILATGGDPDRIIGWAGTTVGPLLGILMLVIRGDQTHAAVMEVKEQTNGNFTELAHEIELLRARVGEAK